ncbi:HlyD family efflux transporter periplasmic adaptor subunit [Alteromonas sp. NFXS44]|uniref:efflux RND transporter periplasmic adaptor subunit n=1 Tax=Alteromonas sp. NFXS44 TaxID=2818435 RepID=UPI0032DE9E5A
MNYSDQQEFMSKMKTLSQQTVPTWYRKVAYMLFLLIAVTAAILYFAPWQQTAYGTGTVSTLNPADRAQPISALVPGQIKTWHVREGQKVKEGDPIVTLVDTDKALVERLQAQVKAAELKLDADLMAVENARINLDRQKRLNKEGLVSVRDIEVAENTLQERLATAAQSEQSRNSLNSSLARQSTQTKYAPQDGTVTQLHSGGLSTLVSAGAVLGYFIPEGVERMVRVKVNGLNAPLVTTGRKVRLQFEGWPIFQFSGWPGTSIGTFGGRVAIVEPVADRNGLFNVWIGQDPQEKPWPEETFARLDSRVNAWILLEEVSIGYELWRQLNNFPPENVRSDTEQTPR